jgi:hypothetical protein
MSAEGPMSVDVLGYRIRDLHRRIGVIENTIDQHNLGVLESRVSDLVDDVKALRRAFYTFAFAVVGSSIVFAFTVFALLGPP